MRKYSSLLVTGIAVLFLHGAVVAAGKTAETVVRDATGEIYAALEEQCELISNHPEYLYQLVDDILLPHADIRRMAKWVLGKYWREIDDMQRDTFEQEFRLLLIRTYATAVQLASMDEISFLPPRDSARPDRATVRAEIRRPGEALVAMHYSLFRNSETWLVFDIVVDGVSLVSNYRTTFADEIRGQGFTGLIASMKHKNSQPMAASTAEQVKSRSARTCDRKTK